MIDREILFTRVYDSNLLEIIRKTRYLFNAIADKLIYSWLFKDNLKNM